jgi:probable phosphoglycerate mutase
LETAFTADLRERHGGIFQGMTEEEMRASNPDALRRVIEAGAAPPGGESCLEVARRIWKKIESIVQDHPGEMVAIVGHGGSLAIIVAHALGFPLGQKARISLRGNTGLSTVEFDGRGPRVTLLNDVNHLAAFDGNEGAGFSLKQESWKIETE